MSDDLSFSDIPTSSLSEDQLRDLMSLCSGIGPSYLSALKKTHGVIVANLRSPEGFVAYIDLPEKDSIYISLICSKKVKGGLGKRLLEHIEGKGRSKILACVVEQAIGFYLRMGFVFSKSISDFPNRYSTPSRRGTRTHQTGQTFHLLH